ncbi:MAG: hypothetical protein OHK0046_17400 [Anaerolineae bacterium]
MRSALKAHTGQNMSELINTDEFKAIKDCFLAWQNAWNRGDLEAFIESYWQSEHTRYVSGSTMIFGFDAIAETYRSRYLGEGTNKMGQMKLEISPDLIREDEALVFGKYQALADDGQIIGHGVFTVHLRQIDHTWKIVSDHASALG